jgi:hypothetical protein
MITFSIFQLQLLKLELLKMKFINSRFYINNEAVSEF